MLWLPFWAPRPRVARAKPGLIPPLAWARAICLQDPCSGPLTQIRPVPPPPPQSVSKIPCSGPLTQIRPVPPPLRAICLQDPCSGPLTQIRPVPPPPPPIPSSGLWTPRRGLAPSAQFWTPYRGFGHFWIRPFPEVLSEVLSEVPPPVGIAQTSPEVCFETLPVPESLVVMAKSCQSQRKHPGAGGGACKRTCKTAHGKSPSIRCGYHKCTKLDIDCKNSCHMLSIKNVNLQQCRCLRKHVQAVRFCSKSHLNRCKLQQKAQNQKMSSRAKRNVKGRVPLTAEQVGILFRTLVQKLNCPWAGALSLLQLLLGDRADAARQGSTEWFRNLNPDSGNPPSVAIPDCNDKTTVREIYLSRGFAALLWHWVLEPLRGCDRRTSWPHPGQNLHGAILNKKPMLLFPGRVRGGKDSRNWDKAISEKAYYNAVREAAGIIQRERAQAHSQQSSHPYDNVDLDRLGTHSMKKTCVTELCEQNVSLAVISQLTGTTEEVLLRHYYKPSQRKQQEAVTNGLAKVVAAVSPNVSVQDASVHCSECGIQRQPDWYFCPKCGAKFNDMA